MKAYQDAVTMLNKIKEGENVAGDIENADIFDHKEDVSIPHTEIDLDAHHQTAYAKTTEIQGQLRDSERTEMPSARAEPNIIYQKHREERKETIPESINEDISKFYYWAVYLYLFSAIFYISL